jgi:hypothetical protein
MICPGCSSPDVRASQQNRWSDAFQRLIGCQAYRCRKCRLRFYAPELSEVTVGVTTSPGSIHRSQLVTNPGSRKRLVRRLLAIAVFTVMFIIFWFYLKYLTTDRTPPDNSQMIQPLFAAPSARYVDKSNSAVADGVAFESVRGSNYIEYPQDCKHPA